MKALEYKTRKNDLARELHVMFSQPQSVPYDELERHERTTWIISAGNIMNHLGVVHVLDCGSYPPHPSDNYRCELEQGHLGPHLNTRWEQVWGGNDEK